MSTTSRKLLARRIDLHFRRAELRAIHARDLAKAKADAAVAEADAEARLSAPINNRLNVVLRSPTSFGLGRNDCRPSRGSQLPRALPAIYFFAVLLLNDCRNVAQSFFKIGRLSSTFSLTCSCPSLSPPSSLNER